jgi:hypothetical protein
MNWIKTITEAEINNLPFQLDGFWWAPYENLNGSGIKFFSEEETDHDILVFVETRSEDNRYMKGGSFSDFGNVYGMNVNRFQEKFCMNPEDAGFMAV